MPYAHISHLDGIAYDYAHHLIEVLQSNDECHGPGTYAGWGSNFNLICDSLSSGFDETGWVALNFVMERELKQIRDGVLDALEPLQAEEAVVLDILKTERLGWPSDHPFPRSMVCQAQAEARSRSGLAA